MKRVRVIPVLLLKGNGLYKTINFGKPKYLGDPINAVKIFNDKEVDEIIILDIDASKEKKEPNYRLLSEIASECFMPMTYGGGIKKMDDAARIFNLGVEKVVINSHFYENPSLVTKLSDKYGSQSIVVSIDYKKTFVGKFLTYSHGGTVNKYCNPIAVAKEAEDAGAGELLVNSIDRDGKRNGYELEILRQITEAVHIPIIACGGAGGMEDIFKSVAVGNAAAASAGSMFVYMGKPTDSILIHYPTPTELNFLYKRLSLHER